jgi:hypothetical protein
MVAGSFVCGSSVQAASSDLASMTYPIASVSHRCQTSLPLQSPGSNLRRLRITSQHLPSQNSLSLHLHIGSCALTSSSSGRLVTQFRRRSHRDSVISKAATMGRGVEVNARITWLEWQRLFNPKGRFLRTITKIYVYVVRSHLIM